MGKAEYYIIPYEFGLHERTPEFSSSKWEGEGLLLGVSLSYLCTMVGETLVSISYIFLLVNPSVLHQKKTAHTNNPSLGDRANHEQIPQKQQNLSENFIKYEPDYHAKISLSFFSLSAYIHNYKM